jgi:hypothetical protein
MAMVHRSELLQTLQRRIVTSLNCYERAVIGTLSQSTNTNPQIRQSCRKMSDLRALPHLETLVHRDASGRIFNRFETARYIAM